ncbi:hypothetical protein D3C77_500290 [compost metagenome]
MSVFGAQLRQGIAEASAGQDFDVEALLLGAAAVDPQYFKGIEMVLWDLPKGGIGLGNARDYLGQSNVGDTSTTKGLGHANGPQAGTREQRQFRMGQAAFAVAQDAVAAQFARQFFCNL